MRLGERSGRISALACVCGVLGTLGAGAPAWFAAPARAQTADARRAPAAFSRLRPASLDVPAALQSAAHALFRPPVDRSDLVAAWRKLTIAVSAPNSPPTSPPADAKLTAEVRRTLERFEAGSALQCVDILDPEDDVLDTVVRVIVTGAGTRIDLLVSPEGGAVRAIGPLAPPRVEGHDLPHLKPLLAAVAHRGMDTHGPTLGRLFLALARSASRSATARGRSASSWTSAYTQPVLRRLNEMGIKFITLRTRSPELRRFLDTPARVSIRQDEVVVQLVRRAHNPILIDAGLIGPATRIPWWQGRSLRIEIA